MPCPSCNVCDEDHPPRLPAGFQLDESSRRRPGRYRFAKLELANQSLRDQFQIAVKFQMILLGVAAAAAFHFKFFLLKNKSYHATPTTLRCDQRRNPLLVGGGSVGPREGTVQQSDRTKRQGTTHEHQPMPGNSASIQRARPAPVPSPRSSSRRSFRAWFLGSRRYAPRLTWRTSVLYLFQVTIETLSEALSYGWRVTARCAHGKRDGMKSIKEVYRAELDMETLVWTRGRSFPLSRLETRLRCPMCGSRDVRLIFTVPRETQTAHGAKSGPK